MNKNIDYCNSIVDVGNWFILHHRVKFDKRQSRVTHEIVAVATR